jgi:hypothetical protein
LFSDFRKKLVIGASAALLLSSVAAGVVAADPVKSADFDMQVSAGAKPCLPNASAEVEIKSLGPVEVMTVDAVGLPPRTDFDFFVIQVPNKPPSGRRRSVGGR